MADQVCRLCFLGVDFNGGEPFSPIRKYEELLENILGPNINWLSNSSEYICANCEYQLEISDQLQQRVQFSQNAWSKYCGPEDEHIKLHCNSNILFNCHVCGRSQKYHDFQSHLLSKHPEHVLDCEFCKIFLEKETLIQLSIKYRLDGAGTQEPIAYEQPMDVQLDQDAPQPVPLVKQEDVSELEESEAEENVDEDYVIEESVEEIIEDDPAESFEEIVEESVDFGAPSDVMYRYVINEEGVRVRRYFCDLCDKDYSRSDKLRKHMQNIHKILIPLKNAGIQINNTCEFCGKMFTKLSLLDDHLIADHGGTPFQCNLCAHECFAVRAELRQHMADHHSITATTPDSDKPYTCNVCCKSFARVEYLRNHVQKNHPGSNLTEISDAGIAAAFVCPFCARNFTRVQKLDLHMLTHGPEPFHCVYCDKSHATRREMREHQETCSTELILLKCDQCEKEFTSQRLLQLHKDEHSDAQFGCPVCGKSFNTRLLLGQHKRTQHEKAFKCNVCGKLLSRQDKLDSHMKQHDGYSCSECGDKYVSRRDLKQHMKIHKPDVEGGAPEKKRICCPKCSMTYVTQQKLQAHMQIDHDPTGYQCAECEEKFDSRAKLKLHAYKHNAKLCGICGEWIARGFSDHMKKHEGVKPYPCQVAGCDMRFRRNCDLRAHTKKHTGEKPFACDFPNCNMRFSRPYKVALHKRTHTGEKPFKCQVPNCNREFAQPFDLKLHLRRHNGDKPFECVCGGRFILNSQLKKHLQVCTHGSSRASEVTTIKYEIVEHI